ncbi:uncharacterized protein ACIB01_018901 isoform 1-T1 [Guaruba guarouba]
MGMDVTGEATGDLQRMSPVPAGPTDTKLTASTLGAAAEEEEHRAPLTPVAQEEAAPAPASPVCGEQEAAPEAQSQALALLSPNASEVVLEEGALLNTRVPPVQAVDQGASQQLVEYQDMTQILDVTVAALTPAALENIESAVAPEPQGEASAAVASTTALEDEVAAALTQIPAAEAGTSHVPAGADGRGDAAASPSSRDSRHQVSEVHVAGTGDPKALDRSSQGVCDRAISGAPCVIPLTLPPSPSCALATLQGMVRNFVRKYLGKAVPVMRGTRQQQMDQPDVAQSLDVESPSKSPAVVQDTEDKPGIATLPDPGAAPRRRLYRFRRALRALGKAFRFSCISPRVEE